MLIDQPSSSVELYCLDIFKCLVLSILGKLDVGIGLIGLQQIPTRIEGDLIQFLLLGALKRQE